VRRGVQPNPPGWFPDQRGLKYCPVLKSFCDRDVNAALNIAAAHVYKHAYPLVMGRDDRPPYLSRDSPAPPDAAPFQLRNKGAVAAAAQESASLSIELRHRQHTLRVSSGTLLY
jgi:hypothetical protein